MEHQCEWQIVTRRRRYPASWSTPTATQQPSPLTYTPFAHLHSYAHDVTNNPTPPIAPNSKPKSLSTSCSPSPLSSPKSSSSSTIYYSPHSPTQLRFPPSPRFEEWRGRCFRCCHTSHTSGNYRFPTKCGKCWGEGHVGTRCKETKLDLAAKPFLPAKKTAPVHLLKRERILMIFYPVQIYNLA
ncbi:hypothetical protein FCM35_KLT12046 [Carex littledalei]|uniref:Uncharacterized protein n=1 Tax=Carex littledalei TaxID=544730 RepID=A0A833QFP6_9POAL|nr:hypothetical protein FCM35_KLT12046 [Carex littledalei]